jgi:hypothetical protein
MKSIRFAALVALTLGLLVPAASISAHTVTTSEWDPATHQMVQVSHWTLLRHPIIGTTTTSVWDPQAHELVDQQSLKLNPIIHIRPPGKHWWNHFVVQDTH